MVKKIFVVGDAKYYASFISEAEIVDSIKDANIVLFTGGEDVDPSLYGEKKHESTFSNINRDLEEKAVFEKINSKKQLAIGICRGLR